MDNLDDDYVAHLLKSEAKSKSSDYNQRGVRALLPTRPTTGAPKPNTRFLRNLVRDVDSHNAALREQETLNKSSRFRLDEEHRRRLGRSDRREHRSEKEYHRDKRRRTRSPSPTVRESRRRRSRSSSPKQRRSLHLRNEHKSHRSRRKEERPRKDKTKARSYESERRRCGSKDRSRSPHTRNRERGSRNGEGRQTATKNCESSSNLAHDDSSDPLEDIIGPLPPPRSHTRGRGQGGKSSMDRRFMDGYDPSVDVEPDSDEDAEWDNAVEAFRDRAKWKQQGAERLRSAGFDDEFITAWENNSIEDESKLRWTAKGATREWDRGKVINDVTGSVELKAQWGSGRMSESGTDS